MAPSLATTKQQPRIFSSAFALKGSVLPRVSVPTIVLALWATVVFLLNSNGIVFRFPNGNTIFLSITSFVISLLLGFRTNTAYDRYMEGRRLWATMTVAARNLGRIIWVGVDEPDSRDNYGEKCAALRLILAYFYSVRNYLRNQYGLLEDAASTSAKFRPEFAGLIPEAATQERVFHGSATLLTAPKYLPLDILFLLTTYIDDHLKNKRVQLAEYTQCLNAVSSLCEALTSMERIVTTPIPVAYSTHLSQCVYLYLFLLPLQLFADFKAISILITALVCFTFVGVSLIGTEIENPMGTDANDLPIDDFIANLELELAELTMTGRADLGSWDLDQVSSKDSSPQNAVSPLAFRDEPRCPAVRNDIEDPSKMSQQPALHASNHGQVGGHSGFSGGDTDQPE